jgi:hypothetical protein
MRPKETKEVEKLERDPDPPTLKGFNNDSPGCEATPGWIPEL